MTGDDSCCIVGVALREHRISAQRGYATGVRKMNSGRKWPGYVLIAFGIANMLYALGGLCFALPVMFWFHTTFEPDPELPYFAQAFFTMASINIFFLVCLIVTGFYLIRKTFKVILFCNILFALELIYFLSIGFFCWPNPRFGMSIAAATGIGNMGIAWQIMTGYPIIGLIVLNIARAKHRTVDRSDNAI